MSMGGQRAALEAQFGAIWCWFADEQLEEQEKRQERVSISSKQKNNLCKHAEPNWARKELRASAKMGQLEGGLLGLAV